MFWNSSSLALCTLSIRTTKFSHGIEVLHNFLLCYCANCCGNQSNNKLQSLLAHRLTHIYFPFFKSFPSICWWFYVFYSHLVFTLLHRCGAGCFMTSVTQRARVQSPDGTSYLGAVFSGFFLTCKTFGLIIVLLIFALLESMCERMTCIVFNVRIVSEVAPALNWSLVYGGHPCHYVIKKVCMWFTSNFLSRQVMAL